MDLNVISLASACSSLMAEHGAELRDAQGEAERMRRELSDKEKEYRLLVEELEQQRDANARAPTSTMKKLVERLRSELALKEKQHQVSACVTVGRI